MKKHVREEGSENLFPLKIPRTEHQTEFPFNCREIGCIVLLRYSFDVPGNSLCAMHAIVRTRNVTASTGQKQNALSLLMFGCCPSPVLLHFASSRTIFPIPITIFEIISCVSGEHCRLP